MAAAVFSVILSSSIGSVPSANLKLRTEGFGSTLDHISTATVAAEVAQETNFMVGSDPAKQAETLNSQVALPTASETTLAKRQIVETAGSEKRVVRSYTVQPGDTLSEIAAQFGITTSTIKWANNLADANDLKPGAQLTILPVSGVLHTVMPGETADSLAAKYSANPAQIISFNNGEVKGLQAGQKVIIPDGVKKEAIRTAVSRAPASSVIPRLTAYFGRGNGYSYGYCTWYVATRRAIPGSWGNAYSWYYNAQMSGFKVGSTPVPGAIAWSSGMSYYGHVGIVESVNGGQIVISDMNYGGNWGRVTTRVDSASRYRYIY